MEIEKVLTFSKQRNLKSRALLEINNEYIEEVQRYIDLAITTNLVEQISSYQDSNKQVFKVPYITFIGMMVNANIHLEPFATCCRYASLMNAKGEKEICIKLINEIEERLEQAKKKWDTLKEEQIPMALKKKKDLETKFKLFSFGLDLVQQMESNLENEENDDQDNEVAKKCIKLLEWGF